MSNRQERNESVAGRGSEKRKKEGKKGRAQKGGRVKVIWRTPDVR